MQIVNNKYFNSLWYILVSGASKGFNYILLLYLAVGIYSGQYITILLLFSLEQILSLLLPLNQSSIIYSKSISDYRSITNKLITSSFIVVLIFVIIFLALKQYAYHYFDVNKAIIFFSLFFSMTINSYLVYLTNYYKLVEEHGKALLIQGLLLISFLSILLNIVFLDDKVVAFFLGKAIGLFIVLLIVKRLKLSKFKYKIGFLSFKEIKQILNLFSVSALGWISGLGFMNLAKIYSTPNQLVEIGYILNIFNIFLLISVGVNSIYSPLIKKHLTKNQTDIVLKIKTKTLIIYLLIVFIVILIYVLFINIGFVFNEKTENVLSVIPYAILLFVFNVFHWVAQPFYMVNNKFNSYNFINISSYIFWVLLILICIYFGKIDFVWFLMAIHFIKGALSYFYAKTKFMNSTIV